MYSDVALPAAVPLPPRRVYPERADRRETALEIAAARLAAPLVAAGAKRRARGIARIVAPVEALAPAFRALDAAGLRRAVAEAAVALRRSEGRDEAAVAQSFAAIRELSGRLTGQRHYAVQLMGGFALLKGMLAELATGEGKTLTATLAAGTAALAGMRTHVVTVNDYLAERDAGLMRPIYEALGLTVGIVVAGMELADRQRAYRCDITYCTNKELAFDYLRDRIVLGQRSTNVRLKLETLEGSRRLAELRLQGLAFAIVDEADSVLIDEARTPLLISATADSELDAKVVGEALALGEALKEGEDYRIITDQRRVALTQGGRARIAALTTPHGGPWGQTVMREELARQAVSALKLFHRGEHYIVREEKVQIVDESTGRAMPDRFWGEGLHQMLELKEGCALSGRRLTIARMTYQRMFRRYRLLSGMSGTVRQVAGEMWSTYRLKVARIPTNRPVQRIHMPDRVLATAEAKWEAIAERTAELRGKGVPVLIGTRSVAASEHASALLAAAGIPHRVLSAAQDGEEAAIVAEAGGEGRVTIATNMAGRGTDIKLAPGMAERGGLHVIMSERHDNTRIDGQLAGRSGRQGEPGCFQAILSLEDPLMEMDRTGLLRRLARPAMALLGERAGRLALRLAQRQAEMLHAAMRRQLLASDRKLNKTLAFSGKPE